jgi:imidazolonepropionase-like amidohydrolase
MQRISRLQRAFLLALALAGAVSVPAAAKEGAYVIHAGKLLADVDLPLRSRVSIIVRDGRIEAITDGYQDPASLNAMLIDLSDRFVLPGLIDTHVHLEFDLERDSVTDEVVLGPGARAVRAAVNARRTVEAGFTTVRDLGSRNDEVYAVRDAIREGRIPGPRILAAGPPISPTAGHGDLAGYEPAVNAAIRTSGICDGADACRAATREAVKRGANVIKVTLTGGVLSASAAGHGAQFDATELNAIVSAAHANGRKVAVHAHDLDGVRLAVAAGADSIEHATFADPNVLEEMRRKGIYLVPTQATRIATRKLLATTDPLRRVQREKARKIEPAISAALGRAHRAGVKIAFGTDAGVVPHGTNAVEFGLMIEAGLTARDTLRAATTNAADLLGLGDTIGRIAVSRAADIIAVDRDPRDAIEVLSNVRFVMAAGTVIKGPGQ